MFRRKIKFDIEKLVGIDGYAITPRGRLDMKTHSLMLDAWNELESRFGHHFNQKQAELVFSYYFKKPVKIFIR